MRQSDPERGYRLLPVSDDPNGSVRAQSVEPVGRNKLGVFMGVYVPSILGAFGVIVYERLGWITAQAGVIQTLVMFSLAYLVTLLTVLSIAAIATNGKMKGGGTYYLISRALGPEFGGSIGVMFFLANVTGAAFYMIGFAEAIISAFGIPGSRWYVVAYGSGGLLAMVIICFVGANMFARSSLLMWIGIMASLLFTMLCFAIRRPDSDLPGYTGLSWQTFHGNLFSHYSETEGVQYDFRGVFSITFPGITGLVAGSNMSGDLKDPAAAIPRGTLLATVTTYLMYAGLVLLMGASVETQTLLDNYFIYMEIAYFGRVVVTVGVILAVLSSALSSVIGGARVMQALARDDVIPLLAPFAVGSAKGDEPRRAVLLTWLLVQCVLLIGSINIIAPFITMFYMISFLSTNFACFFLSVTGAPNFRPRFRYFHWSTALFGAVMAAVIMFYSDAISAGISTFIVLVLFIYIHYRAPVMAWGDVMQALIYHQVRKFLLRLDTRKDHVKFWRPQILLLVSDPQRSLNLISFVETLKKSGLYLLGNVIVGDWATHAPSVRERRNLFLEFIEAMKIKAFPEVAVGASVRAAVQYLLLNTGIGGFKPNTLVIGLPSGQRDARRAIVGPNGQRVLRSPSGAVRLGDRPWIKPPRFQFKKKGGANLAPVLDKFLPPDDAGSLDVVEYVEIIKDAILVSKNVILAANFAERRPKPAPAYIDCWLLDDVPNALLSSDPSCTDATLLLLAEIINRRSSKTRLRVLSAVRPADVQLQTSLLSEMVFKFRIMADVLVLPVPAPNPEEPGQDQEFDALPSDRQHSALNELIALNSSNTVVTFLPLARPPAAADRYAQYLDNLRTLTRELPPTLLLYGVQTVLTNEL